MSVDVSTRSGSATDVEKRVHRVDTDTHNLIFENMLLPYLSPRWQRYMEEVGLRQTSQAGLTIGAHPLACRTDAWSPNGAPPGTVPSFFAEQLLDEHQIDVCILNSTLAQGQNFMGPGSPSELVEEVARAGNMYMEEAWLDADDRFRGAMVLPFEDAAASVREIERCATDSRWVQILLPFRTIDPIGQKKYLPIFEAAVDCNLPVALHPAAQHVTTGAGWQSFYYEHHTALPSALLTQMSSLIFEGVFDQFPDLQILFQEGGWSWVAPYMWRLDSVWQQLGSEIEGLQMTPSDYVRKHFWFTTQPIEEPDKPEYLNEMWDQFRSLGMGERLMYSSDYPHWDFDAPDRAIPKSLSPETRQAIFVDNAVKCYKRLGVVAGEAR